MIPLTPSIVASVLLLFSVLSSLLLGITVFVRNPTKRTHRLFWLVTLNVSLWALGVLIIIHSRTPESARLWIQLTFAVAAFLPATFFHFLAFFPFQRLEWGRGALYALYGGAALTALLAFSPWYVREVALSPNQPPAAVYGPVFYMFSVLAAFALVVSTIDLYRKLKITTGIQRRQVETVIFAFYASTALALSTNVIAPAMEVGRFELYGPCFMVLMMAALAYSMVRYHLLDVWGILTRTTAYGVITIFVVGVFWGAITLAHLIFVRGAGSDLATAILAALVVVLVLQPLREWVQLGLQRSLLHRRYDAPALIERITCNASQFVHLHQMLNYTAGELRQKVGVRDLQVLLFEGQRPRRLRAEFSTRPKAAERPFIPHEFLLEHLDRREEPLILEQLLLDKATPERAMLARDLAEMDAQVLVPLKTMFGAIGVLLIGEKDSRAIYTLDDIAVFRAIAPALAAGIENARLYQRLEALNMHLERIMSSMRGGVLAVDAEGNVTTVNDEARALLGTVKVGGALDDIDAKVAAVLRHTLQKKGNTADVEMVLMSETGEKIPVAVSSSYLGSAGQESLGAMVLLYNLSEIRRLEDGVRRADRMTSIGTMAAGMAHEIKNPLQSIKTFTQLLPQRYHDADFRDTFAEVVPPEVERIDTIVKRLLRFARPRPVHFASHNIAVVVREVLALVENQLRKTDVEVLLELPQEDALVMGDDQQLHQVFLNLVLNAIDAMDHSMRRELRITIKHDVVNVTRGRRVPLFEVRCVRVAVSDTGCGIPKGQLDQLFTPFFTTKDEGSGLGLSVAHRIIVEHEGAIDVTSVEGAGTTFTLTFPLLEGAEQIAGAPR